MAEVITHDGTWTFDGDVLRIVPGTGRTVHRLRQLLGELAVPVHAIAGIAYEPAKKGGALRLRLREGADPVSEAAAGALSDSANPYRLVVGTDRTGVAEYFAEEVRNALVIEQVPAGPTDRYLLPGPQIPVTARAGDGTGHFDGERIRLEWNWTAESSKQSAGPNQIQLRDLAGVELHPSSGLDNGHLRFRLKGTGSVPPPKHDPNCLMLWGFKKEGAAAVVLTAAIIARLPHRGHRSDTGEDVLFAVDSGPGPAAAGALPAAAGALPAATTPAPSATTPAEPAVLTTRPEPSESAAPAGAAAPAPAAAASPAPSPGVDDHDALLRRLRELAELRRDGVLTEAEFVAAKEAVLRRF